MILILASVFLISGPSETEPKGDYIVFSGYSQKEEGENKFGITTKISGVIESKFYRMGDTIIRMKIIGFEKKQVPHFNEITKVTEYHDASVLTLLDLSSKNNIKLTMWEFRSLINSNTGVHATAVNGGA